MKKVLLAATALLVGQVTALAQSESSSYSVVSRGGVMNTFVHDYQAIGVNPANLGRSTSFISFTVAEFGGYYSSQAFTRRTLKNAIKLTSDSSIGEAERQELASAFTSDNVLNIGADVNTLALSVSLPKIGGFAISNRQRMLGHAGFNKNFAELLFLGQDASMFNEVAPDETLYVSELFDGSEIKMSWVNEWNLAYGRKIMDLPLINIYGGVGYKYLQGLGLYEFSAKGGKVKAYNAFSPVLDANYDDYRDDPKFNYDGADGLLNPVGRGHGVDLGLSAEIIKIVKVSASVTDIGNIKWTENLLEGQDKGFTLEQMAEDGANNNDFWKDAGKMARSIVDSALVFSPVSEMKVSLPTRFRFGAGVKIGQRVEVGVDYVAPLNKAPGNLAGDFVGLGIDFSPVPVFRLSSGVSSGAGDKVNIPFGFAITSPVYEFGIGMRDVTAPFTKNNPGASVAMGFLRFKIGKPQLL
ncbi:hypothetical protein H8S95_07360 [Pontibacter sp. KCTC 32443]|uniref:DUF5723 family protein n=1 Tax=Pontibacter TaxID=323449 RepID=UPI00164E87A8|nr:MULTISPECIES: DUF5723 family protein [Pontibacter]MBC5773876.1 hypothetical protein [Pontibacter sp. KCTC 32443]